MTQEEKQLLLKDLCARLPYGVKFQGEDSNVNNDEPDEIRCIGTSSALCDRGALIKEEEK